AFLTARGTQSWLRIGWSFFAGSMGAWAIALPAGYAVEFGLYGVIAYALASGLPCVMIAFLGKYVQLQWPKPLSLTDFTNWRFGLAIHILVIFLCLFNMSLALISEYSVLSSVFRSYLQVHSWPILFLMGICTLVYSAYGGLATSILTDQFQGICALLFTVFLAVYLGATFRPELPSFPKEMIVKEGAWSFFTLTFSLASAVMYSESFWQRVWASKSFKDTKKAGFFSFFLAFLVIFFFGICGILAFWAFKKSSFDNLIVFDLLPEKYSWVGGFLVFFLVVMNQGCIDSLQNGLAATLAATFCKDRNLWVTRFVLIFLNIPCLIIGYLEPNVINVFLLSNMITGCAFIPMVLGFLDIHQQYIHALEFLLSFLFGILGITLHGLIKNDFDFIKAITWSWWGNNYNGYLFITLLGSSVLGIIVSLLVRKFLTRRSLH
ncbi:hypothetical protein HMI55_002642, partial [Coelomomyces lativittatus]